MEHESESVSSTPRSLSDEKQHQLAVVRLMVSFGGKIVPRPHDNQLRYVGGDTRIIAVNRCISFSTLITKLSKLLTVEFSVKYQLPNEELDALITVSTDEDVENMMEEFDRLTVNNNNSSNNNKVPRLRLFLFPLVEGDEEGGNIISRSSSIASLLDGSKKRESWFLDALNGGSTTLERGRSEASSIVSEVPDYLFGFDNNSDDMPPPPPQPVKFRNRSGLSEVGGPGSDPGSPAYGSGSSAPPMPDLPPVKTKPEKTTMSHVEDVSGGGGGGGGGGGVVWGPGSPYTGGHPVQPMPVYYVPATGSGPGMVGPPRNVIPVTMPVQSQYVPQYGPAPVQVQVGYPGPGPGPMYEVPMQRNMVPGQGTMNMINHHQQQQPMYYGVKNGGMVGNYPGMGMGMGMGMPVSRDDQDGSNIRSHQG